MKFVVRHVQLDRQPGWVFKAAGAAVLLLVVLPLALLSLAALAVGVAVFLGLALVVTAWQRLLAWLTPGARAPAEVRRNVRVIRDEEEPHG